MPASVATTPGRATPSSPGSGHFSTRRFVRNHPPAVVAPRAALPLGRDLQLVSLVSPTRRRVLGCSQVHRGRGPWGVARPDGSALPHHRQHDMGGGPGEGGGLAAPAGALVQELRRNCRRPLEGTPAEHAGAWCAVINRPAGAASHGAIVRGGSPARADRRRGGGTPPARSRRCSCWATAPPSRSMPPLPAGLGCRCGWRSCRRSTGSCTGPRSCWPCPTSPATPPTGGRRDTVRRRGLRLPQERAASAP